MRKRVAALNIEMVDRRAVEQELDGVRAGHGQECPVLPGPGANPGRYTGEPGCARPALRPRLRSTPQANPPAVHPGLRGPWETNKTGMPRRSNSWRSARLWAEALPQTKSALSHAIPLDRGRDWSAVPTQPGLEYPGKKLGCAGGQRVIVEPPGPGRHVADAGGLAQDDATLGKGILRTKNHDPGCSQDFPHVRKHRGVFRVLGEVGFVDRLSINIVATPADHPTEGRIGRDEQRPAFPEGLEHRLDFRHDRPAQHRVNLLVDPGRSTGSRSARPACRHFERPPAAVVNAYRHR